MFTKIKRWCKSPLFTEAVMGGALLLVAVIALIAVFVGTDPKPQPAAPTATTAAPTEPTNPSPLAANPLKPTDFVKSGNFITCTAAPSVVGIDVSEHQTEIDWQQVKAAGVDFVMIRVGWQGYTQGALFADSLAQTHYAGAKAAGLKVGAYIFSQAITPEEGAGNAAFLLEQIASWQIDMPLVINWEHMGDENRTTDVNARQLTDITKAFCDAVAKAGHTPMVYFNADLAFGRMQLEELADYGFWFAQYAEQLNFPYKVQMWQYTATGSVPGVTGDVDIDLYFP